MRRCVVVSTVYVEPALRGKLRALGALGLDVTAAVPQRWPEPVYHRWRETGWERHHSVEVFPLPMRGSDTATARFARRPLVTLLRDKRPDVVQIEEPPGSPIATQVARAAAANRLPVVFFSAVNVRWNAGWLTHMRRQRALRRARGAIAGSAGAAALLTAVRSDLPVETIPQCGVAVPPFPAHTLHAGLHLGFVGRLEPRDGLDTLLEALARLRHMSWTLTVVGDGPGRERLEAMANSLRLAARIRWAGALPAAHVLGLWPTLDALVCPGRRLPEWEEPHGDVAAEAMAHEVAVVATATGVLPELIGDAGLVVPSEDTVSLADAIALLADPAQQRALAQAARARALAALSEDAVAERTLEFWRRILA